MFRPIDCVQTNVQPGFRRFSSDSQPLIKSWRCELTGLSHSYNLYFVACNDAIHIYTPNFPTQALARDPELVLQPPISSPMLDVGIDDIDPHSITRLHVDYLGREEVLLVTCDDGDVVGYRVPEIYRVITENQRSPSPRDPYNQGLANKVRVFLHKNVGGSAWGLAVHREARLIAISANTHRVTVLAYALSGSAADPDLESFESDEERGDFPHPRRRDHVITLQAATNIPAVFFNQDDASGRWLFSSSIDGDHLWDLYNPREPARMIELGYCVSAQDPTQPPGPCRCQNRTSVPHAAWGAMFIDPRSCHQTTSLSEACGPGYGGAEQHPARVRPGFWDITERKIRFSAKRSGPMPTSFDQTESLSDESDQMSLSGSEPSAASGSMDEEDADVESEEEESDHMSTNVGHISNVQEAPLSNNIPSQEAPGPHSPHPEPPTQPLPQAADLIDASNPTDLAIQTPVNPEAEFFAQQLLNLIPDAAQHPELTALWLDANDPIDMSDDDESDSSISQDQLQLAAGTLPVNWISLGGSQAVLGPHHVTRSLPPLPKHPYCTISTSQAFENIPDRPSNPCIIVTKDEVYLFQRPFDSTGDGQDPILAMQDPLFPPMKAARAAPNYHRNCYTTQIPELGIFITASPAGRVAIFSLTAYTDRHRRHPLYAFRMDHLLPSSRRDGELVVEEVWGRRLVGVATGPVQGMLDRSEEGNRERERGGEVEGEREIGQRRWRLMLYFHDHTVYSYELGKFGGREAPGLGDLVV